MEIAGVRHQASSLFPNEDGVVELLLIQPAVDQSLVGNRQSLLRAQEPVQPSPNQIEACKKLLQETKSNSLTVMSFHPGLAACEEDLRKLAIDRTIVGLVGLDPDRHNSTLIATSHLVMKQAKISLSSEDEDLQVKRGRDLNLFEPIGDQNQNGVRWAVLNCHDYTHVDLLNALQETKVEVLVIVTYNTASRLYWQYAISDVHRLFCYVVIANVAELGGSGVFAPFRRIGRGENAQLSSGGQIFGARGPGEFEVRIPLDIGELRSIRKEFTDHGFQAPAIVSSRGSIYSPMVPSEHFMQTVDREAGPPRIDNVLDVPTDWNLTKPRVALSQLRHIGADAYDVYYETMYRIRQHPSCGAFEYLLLFKLLELEARCRQLGEAKSNSLLDLLVLPEVFVPRSFLPTLQGFSNRMGAIVVAGIDYPDGGEEENANECVIIRPYQRPFEYRKITRSQYDACRNDDGDRMPMRRGSNLVRFVNEYGRGFGVLICYDFSHFDLLWNLNLSGRETPLDIIVVVAHNPFGDLYRACCIADSHRFYQYIIMSNVSKFGGSGIFAPIRTLGARQVLMEAGKKVETISLAELDLDDLISSRQMRDQELHGGRFMRRPGVFQTRWPRDY